MIMESAITVTGYSPAYRPSIRKILAKLGWTKQYIAGMENAVDVFVKYPKTYGVSLAISNIEAVGYIMPRYYENDLDGVTYQKFFDR